MNRDREISLVSVSHELNHSDYEMMYSLEMSSVGLLWKQEQRYDDKIACVYLYMFEFSNHDSSYINSLRKEKDRNKMGQNRLPASRRSCSFDNESS